MLQLLHSQYVVVALYAVIYTYNIVNVYTRQLIGTTDCMLLSLVTSRLCNTTTQHSVLFVFQYHVRAVVPCAASSMRMRMAAQTYDYLGIFNSLWTSSFNLYVVYENQ